MSGKVYVASMNMRGCWAVPPNQDIIKLNVTSAQSKSSKNRRDFSPMTMIKDSYKGFLNFESYWQSGKVYDRIDHKLTKEWWRLLTEPKRRYPNSKNNKILYAQFDDYPNEHMDYLASRKKIYVPEYFDLMKNTEMAQFYKKLVEQGTDVIVYDFDGPRCEDGSVTYMEANVKNLKTKLNDLSNPFGHGYIVAGWLKGIYPSQYI
ncbi:MAG: hypothetical protein Gaeavirus3_3 [Gaeavirus sp.]|uniref:Uncharacterized protein n=1 Tax=Gaeavirus sp. TaxID=2487767 RepID=A0A3G5A397_9VIRU|nr:MAG: hypothetical protein Gaeavirus3_3 [Gaeavirus sp.]